MDQIKYRGLMQMKICLKAIFFSFILFCLLFQTGSPVTYEFRGTSTGYSGTNLIYVNITESNIPALIGEREVLLPQPVSEYILNYLVGMQLSFDYLGRDITGKLISDAYFNNIRLQDLQSYSECGNCYPYCCGYFYAGYYGYYGHNYYVGYGY
jgi:hypothetical protein